MHRFGVDTFCMYLRRYVKRILYDTFIRNVFKKQLRSYVVVLYKHLHTAWCYIIGGINLSRHVQCICEYDSTSLIEVTYIRTVDI